MNIQERLSQCQMHINALLTDYLPSPIASPLSEAMHYACLNGGKRLRPLLVYTTAQMLGQPWSLVDPLAVAIELIHCYSLVHDDLPSMDNDDLRRGKPTCHRQFDEATAILAGDGLLTLAFEILSNPQHFTQIDANVLLTVIHKVSQGAGAIKGMLQGQMVDLNSTYQAITLPELIKMHQAKTGALIHASIECAALMTSNVNPEDLVSLKKFSEAIGLAFQIQDDILDAQGDSQTMGKNTQQDAKKNKCTFVTLLGLEQAKSVAKEMHQQAKDHLMPFKDKGKVLSEISDYIIERVA